MVGPVPATHGPQTTGSHGPGLLFISAAITNLVYLHDRFFLKQRFINVILFSVGASLRDRSLRANERMLAGTTSHASLKL